MVEDYMKKKVLFIATVASHINTFHIPDIEFFKDNDWETHVVVGTDPEIRGDKKVPVCDVFQVLPFSRSPLKIKNLVAIHQLKEIINKERFSIIHCHTPMGSVVARVAAKSARRKFETKVIYTCHGAHFYKGAPFINWAVYYPIEKILSRYTDCLITINKEDFHRMSNKFKHCNVEFIPGVGFSDKFQPVGSEEKAILRAGLGYSNEDFLLMFVGELNNTKNQGFLIEVLQLLKGKIPKIRLVLVGIGTLENQLKRSVKELGLEKSVDFLGYRTDVPKLLNIADVYIASSKREGLAVNILEALGSGLPIVVTDARGQSDLIIDGMNGFVVDKEDSLTFAERIEYLYQNPKIIKRFGIEGSNLASNYKIDKVRHYIEDVYRRYMK